MNVIGQFRLSGFMQTLVSGGGAAMSFNLGPVIAYGNVSFEQYSFFEVFQYVIDSSLPSQTTVTTPGTLALQINEVMGQPVAVVTGSSSVQTVAGQNFLLEPDTLFSVSFQATIGEPFAYGIGMFGGGGGGNSNCDPTLVTPPCSGGSTYNLLLAQQAFVLPENVVMSEFAGAAVPEPGSLLLLGSGIAAWRLRRGRLV